MDQTLTTERLTLRMPERRDAKVFAQILGHDLVAPQTGGFWVGYDIRSAEGRIDISRARWVSQRAYEWLMELEGEVVGYIGLFQTAKGWEIGYAVHPDHWRQGFAREAVSTVIDAHMKHHPATPLRAIIQTGNPGSRALVEALGFSPYPGTTTSYCFARDSHVDVWTLVHPGSQEHHLYEAAQ